MGERRSRFPWLETRGGVFLDEDNNRVMGMVIEGIKQGVIQSRFDNLTLIRPAQRLVVCVDQRWL